MNAFLEGKRLTSECVPADRSNEGDRTLILIAVYNRTQEAMSQQLQEEVDEDDNLQPLNLVDHFIALLLAIFIESGLLEVGLSPLKPQSMLMYNRLWSPSSRRTRVLSIARQRYYSASYCRWPTGSSRSGSPLNSK
jgi:hypothetical protein